MNQAAPATAQSGTAPGSGTVATGVKDSELLFASILKKPKY
jgi:hypothetical protein